MYLSGLVLVSGVLDFVTVRNNPGNDTPYPLYLPAYLAAAQVHKKLPPDLQSDLPKALAEAREFAKGEYPAALQRGDSLSTDERKKSSPNSRGSPAFHRKSSKTTICGWAAACSASNCCTIRA